MNKRPIVFPGQHVITSNGATAIVAFVAHGNVYVFGSNGLPKPATIVGDAWGGEHDQALGLAA